jgi:glycerophosphoryl diester phosphodiesterase
MVAFGFLSLAAACSAPEGIEIHGHRGCRGYLPENSLEGFVFALRSGVPVLEMDVVISGDGAVVVSHEPWLNSTICLDQMGLPIPDSLAKAFNLFQMPYETIAQCDCGSLGHPDFPNQRPMKAPKPLLHDVIAHLEALCEKDYLAHPTYSIELKSTPETDGVFHPNPAVFVEKVLRVIAKNGVRERVVIQSFDPRILKALRKQNPRIKTSYLTEDPGDSPEKAMATLGFKPTIYSPYYKHVNPDMVTACNALGVKLIPWTINDPNTMQELMAMGVNGIITDVPLQLFEILNIPY